MTDRTDKSPPAAAADKTAAPAGGRDAKSDWARIAQDDESAAAPDLVMKSARKRPDNILKK